MSGENVSYLGDAFTRDMLVTYLGPDANILPLPDGDEGVEFLRGQGDLILVPRKDSDPKIRSVAAMLRAAGLQVAVSPVSAEWFCSCYLPSGHLSLLLKGAPRDIGGHVVLTLEEFFAQQIPDHAMLLGPIHEQDVGFLAAWRGTGKTLFNLSVSVAIASGIDFLGWEAPSPRPVLYIDGEMPFPLLRAHLDTVIKTFRPFAPKNQQFDPAYLRILTPDVQPDGLLPSLATKGGRQRMDDILGDAALVVYDNLSCLVGGNAENDVEEYWPIREYQQSIRRRGIASILVHHAGKGGDQRGHSGKQDLLDLSILLEPPAERERASGAKFKLRFDKVRRDLPWLRDLDVELKRGDPPEWSHRTIGEAVDEIVHKLSEDGHSLREIVQVLRDDHGLRKSINSVRRILSGNDGEK